MLLNLTNLFSMVKVAPIKVAPDFTAVSKQGTIDYLCDHIKPSIEFFIVHGDGIKHQFQKKTIVIKSMQNYYLNSIKIVDLKK
ncbi:hypothetical protein [Rickettsia endosymbiont of Cantharis rufa]|uniref:hypothetical protein n=1 Tax=Rickettsia endosymbiont of Cantharis rufa TaxID=3066248 RepID=UPI003132BB22